MNTIHSSSLAFYPIGHKQPKVVRPDSNAEQKQNSGRNETGIKQKSRELPKSSSTSEIQAALNDNRLIVSIGDQPRNPKILKALNTYTENLNQTAKTRVADSISGIDLYV